MRGGGVGHEGSRQGRSWDMHEEARQSLACCSIVLEVCAPL